MNIHMEKLTKVSKFIPTRRPKKEVLDDNISNDPRTPAGGIRKDDGQPDETINRKEELVDDNMIVDDKMGYDPCTPVVTVRKDRNKQIKL